MREGWEYKKLSELSIGKLSYGSGASAIDFNGIVRYIRITDIDDNGELKENCVSPNVYDENYLLSDGDILFARSGATVGKTYLFKAQNIKCVYAGYLIRFVPNQQIVIPSYVFHYTNSPLYKSFVAKVQRAVAQPNINAKQYGDLQIPIPPKSTQLAIVSELDKINELIRLKKEQLVEYDNLAQSIFYEMFGDPVENEKGWEVKTFGDAFIIGSGGTPSKNKSEYWENGDIPWIGSNMCQNCVINKTDGKFITKEGLNHSSAKMLTPGTVLVALVGATIGKVGLLKTETSTNQNIAFIKVNESHEFIPEFVYFHLMNQYHEFMNLGNGDFKMANQSFIKALPIIKTPLPLQQSFASRIEQIEKLKSEVQNAITDLETLLASRMQYWFE